MSYIVTLPYDPTWKASERGTETFGDGNFTTQVSDTDYEKVAYMFKNEADAVFFALKWL